MSERIRHVVVIGAGTMGAAIAAHLANVGIPAFLLDIVPNQLTEAESARGLTLDDPVVRNRIVREGFERMTRSRPPSLFTKAKADTIALGNLEDNFDWVGEADWIIEAIIERLDIKQQLMARIEEVRKPGSIISTNTSGIPIQAIAEGRSDDFKAHFLGTHFFNPPRYLKLLEIIPHEQTKPEVIEFMVEFGTRTLGKGVVICKDTPNFIANRFMSVVGAYTLNYVLDHGYTVKEVDALTGPIIGHPKTATFRLYDLVGLDVMAHVNANLYPAIPHDPYREKLKHERSSALIQAMVENNWLGNKTRQGFYKRMDTEEGRQFWELDLETMEHQPPTKPRFESVGKHKDVEDVGERIKRLCAEEDRGGQFIWATTAFGLNYAASVVPEVSDDIVSIDSANKWGFNHELGPFEIWDALGVAESVQRMEAEGMAVTPWVKEMLSSGLHCQGGFTSFYQKENGQVVGYYDPSSKGYKPLPVDPHFIVLKDLKAQGKEIKKNLSASLVDLGDGVACLEFHSKVNALDPDIVQMMRFALEEVDRNFVGLVIGNQGEHFCVGANIFNIAVAAQQGMFDQLDQMVQELQSTMQAIRFSPKPVVAAPFSMTLGGGAEVAMAASRICAAAELYMGQVEFGVGLIPAAGGCKELLRRVVSPAVKTPNADPLPFLQQVFEAIGLAKVSGSAEEAREIGFLSPADRVVINRDHLLAEAKRTVLEMAEAGYRPPLRDKTVYAVGRDGLAALRIAIHQLEQGGYASEHDALIARKLAYVLCGGELSEPQWVDESYILDLEREAFVSLCGEPKTLERIWHMLQTGRPLRN